MTVTKADPAPPRKRSHRAVRRRPLEAAAPAPPRKADMRRAALIQAAILLLVDRGMKDCPIDDIAAEAGVAKGTFYHYFDSKTALIDALREHFLDSFEERLLSAVEGCAADDWTGRLETWVVTATNLCFDLHALHDLVFHGPAMPHRQAIGEADIVIHLAGILAEGEAAGAWNLKGDGAAQVAALIFHGLHGMADDALALGRPADGLGRQLARLYRRMVTG